jgi:hypothetical protein
MHEMNNTEFLNLVNIVPLCKHYTYVLYIMYTKPDDDDLQWRPKHVAVLIKIKLLRLMVDTAIYQQIF